MKTHNFDTFPFKHIFFSQPKPIGGGGYFIKINDSNDIPLCIQFPKCVTKNGLVKTKRHNYTDLLYEKESSESVIQWIEQIETKCLNFLDEKKNIWFGDDITKEDIENMLNPIYRLYKSGKNVCIRSYIDYDKKNDKNILSIFNEDGRPYKEKTDLDDISFIPLIQLSGIKFSTKSIEIELKLLQGLVIKLPSIEETCLILRNNQQFKKYHEDENHEENHEDEEKHEEENHEDEENHEEENHEEENHEEENHEDE